jgi:hypothetical protein
MGKLCEDNRVMTFAQDTEIPHDTYLNEVQDQQRGMFKGRWLNCTGCFNPDQNAGADVWYITNDRSWIVSSAVSGFVMVAHLPLREGEKILNIDVTYKGSNQTGGSMELYSHQDIAVGNQAAENASVKIADLGANGAGGNPWQPAANPLNYHRVRTAINTIVAADTRYYVKIAASTAGGIIIDVFCALWVQVQFGN